MALRYAEDGACLEVYEKIRVARVYEGKDSRG